MSGKMILMAALLFLLLLLAFACAPAQPALPSTPVAPTPAVSAPATSPPAAPAPLPATRSDWDKLVEAAKKEGKVRLYSSTMPAAARVPLMNAFHQTYAIGLEIVVGTSSDIVAKLDAERRAKTFVADVYDGGSTTFYAQLKPMGIVGDPLKVPAVADKSLWRVDPFSLDPEGYFLLYTASGSGFLINTNLVKPQDEPKSWLDLLEPRWKGKILMDDPTRPGSGNAMFYFALKYVGGQDYWQKMAKQEMKFIRDRTELTNMVVRGEYPLVIATYRGPNLAAFKAGAPVKLLVPKEGLGASPWGVCLVRNAPHPKAALVFLNWFLSREGQTVYSTAAEDISFRQDVSQESVHPQFRIKPGVPPLTLFAPEDYPQITKAMELSAQIFGIPK